MLLDSSLSLLFNNVVSIFFGAIISKRDKKIAPVPQSRIFFTCSSLSLVGETKIRRVRLHGGSWHAFQRLPYLQACDPYNQGAPPLEPTSLLL